MNVDDTKDLARLDAILYDRPAGRSKIGHAIDTITQLRDQLAAAKERLDAVSRSRDQWQRDYEALQRDAGLVQPLIDAGAALARLHESHYNPPGSVGTAIADFRALVRRREG